MRCSLLLVVLAGCPSKPRAPAPPPPLAADAYAHYLRGRLAALEGDDAAAAAEFGKASAAAPGEPAIAVARIEALLGARRRDAAVRAADRALARWPERPAVLLAAGKAYRSSKRNADAIAALERARRQARGDELAGAVSLELAAVYIAVEQPGRAVAVYRSLIADHPDLITPRVRLLSLLVKQRAFADAEAVGRRLLELRSDHVQARVLYARALRERGKRDEALAVLRGAFERSGRVSVGARLFDALLESGDRHAAIEVLEYLAGGADLDDEDRVQIGQLFLRVGHPARAESLADAALADGFNEDAAVLRASALAARRKFDEAARAITEIKSPPLWALTFGAEMLAHAGHRDRALALLDEVEAQPQREIARSRVLELAGDVAAARLALLNARTEWAGDRDLIYALAALELRAGNHREAARLADQLLAGDPDSLQLQNFLGYVLADGGLELERARRLLVRALRRSPGSAGILDSVGWMHFRRGSLGVAAEHLYRAVRLAPVEAEILFHVGSLERALGRRRAARHSLRLARSHALEPSLRKQIDAELARLQPRRPK